jgi:hypothetical protein
MLADVIGDIDVETFDVSGWCLVAKGRKVGFIAVLERVGPSHVRGRPEACNYQQNEAERISDHLGFPLPGVIHSEFLKREDGDMVLACALYPDWHSVTSNEDRVHPPRSGSSATAGRLQPESAGGESLNQKIAPAEVLTVDATSSSWDTSKIFF